MIKKKKYKRCDAYVLLRMLIWAKVECKSLAQDDASKHIEAAIDSIAIRMGVNKTDS